MKKLLILMLCAAMALSLAACGGNSSGNGDKDGGAGGNTQTDGSTQTDGGDTAGVPGGNTQIANPFVTCQTLEEAAELAGFDMTVPAASDGDYARQEISAIQGQMIQVVYQNGDGEKTVTVRKAPGADDISGDFNTYAEEGTLDVDGLAVGTRGADGLVNTATWANGDYAYAIHAAAGLDSDAVTELVQAIQ